MRKLIAALAACATLAGIADAQEVYHWPVPQQYDPGAPRIRMPIGTPIMLAPITRVSSKDDLKSGQRVFLRVMENVSYEGQVLIPAGAPAFGRVMYAERNGHFGKRGSVGINLEYVQTPYGPVQLTGESEKRGHSGTALSVSGIVLLSPWFFLVHGTSARIEAMTPIQGYLASPVDFTVQTPQPVQAATVVHSDQDRQFAARAAAQVPAKVAAR